MNSQVCLALAVTLCLSNAAQTLGGANYDATELIKQIKGNKDLLDAIRLIFNKMADNHTSSEGTSTPTQPVTSQTTTKPLPTKQAVISQPTDTTASSKPLTSTQAVVTETRTKETSNKSLSTTQPVASETATNSNVPRNDNNTTEDGAKSDATELIKQIKDNKDFLDALRLILNKMADNHASSEGTSTPTQPVTSQTTTKPLSTKQADISQPTDMTASSKPLTSTQAVVTETRTKETSNKSLPTTQPVASETATNSNVPRNDNNTTEGGANYDATELIKQIKGNKDLLDALRLILKMADDPTSSEGTSTPTQPVTSQAKQAVISQPTDMTTSSKPLISTQPVATPTTTKETSTKPLSTTQPRTTQPTVTTASSKRWTSTQPVATQTTTNETLTKETSNKSLSTTQSFSSQTTTNSNVSRNDNNSTEGESKDSDTTNEFTSFQLPHHSSSFPVFFMLILLIMVACYFAYHNRTKIHRFIKEGYGKAKQSGTAYVKVKLEDDIELTSEANRQYVY